MFQAAYHDLSLEHPEWGRVAVLPWDSDLFGFGVGDFKPGKAADVFRDRGSIAARLTSWSQTESVELIGCSVTSAEGAWRALLPHLGFAYVDSTLTYTLPKLQTVQFGRKHAPVRLATREDEPAVLRICETGFRAGRYHADPLFPLTLANARYRRWLANEFESLGETNRIYVAGEVGAAIGFTHVRVNGTEAYITIGGADPAVQSSVLPFAVFIGTLEALRDSGVRRAQSKLSAANTPMLNLASYAGSRFSEPETVFHWRRPGSAHLVAFDALFS